MKKRWIFVIPGLVLIMAILACGVTINTGGESFGTVRGSGIVTQEDRSVSGVSGVELSMQGTLHIEVGSSESLRIEAEDNLLQYIQTDVRGGRLEIHTPSGTNLQNTKSIDYYLTVKSLDEIVISSSGDVEAPDLQSGRFSVAIHSSGNLTMGDLDCTSLQVEISSSGDVSMKDVTGNSVSVRISSSGNLDIAGGQVRSQEINISSSGEYRARNMASTDADVTISSSGTATIRVSDHLNGRLSSSGSVYYIGNPQVNINTSSSGKAVQISE